MKLGDAVKAMRKQAGMTADELAEKSGTTKSSISRIENEEQTPSLDMLDRIAAGLGVKLYQLFAQAEGVRLPVAKASVDEADLLKALRAMEPDARDHYVAIARSLAGQKLKGDGEN